MEDPLTIQKNLLRYIYFSVRKDDLVLNFDERHTNEFITFVMRISGLME